MRHLGIPILALACGCLVAVQATGVHMHLNAEGYSGPPAGMHVHGATLQYHDPTHGSERGAAHTHAPRDTPTAGGPWPQPDDTHHQGDRDVSVAELGAGPLKGLALSLVGAIGITLANRALDSTRAVAAQPIPPTQRQRWRPPLRAPPASGQRAVVPN